MAEDRAGYTTGSPADATDAGQADPTQNISAFPQRTWTQVDNSYYDRVLGKVSMAAWGVLSYFHRYALGYHRTDVRVSVNEIARLLGMALHTTQKALKELEDVGLLASDASERKRTQARTYTLCLMTEWRLPLTTAKTAVDDTEASIEATAINDVVDDVTTAKTAVDGGQTTAKIAPLIKKTENKQKRERKETANAGETAKPLTTSRASPSPARKSASAEKRPRKQTDEQNAAHRVEAVYVNAVIDAFQAELNVHKLPEIGQQRSGAHWFYTAGPDGQPIPPDDLMEWYRLTKRRAWWRGKFLSLVSIEKPFTEHGGDLTAYRATIAQEATEGDHHATTSRAYGSPAYAGRAAARSATQQPDPRKDGVYAAFVD